MGKFFGYTSSSKKNSPICASFGYKDRRFYILLKIKDKNIMALIDSGSTKTYIGKLGADVLGDFKNTDSIMTAANKNTVKVNGIKWIKFSLRGIEHRIETRFIESLSYNCILGTDFLRTFGLCIDFKEGVCYLPGRGESWKVNFPEDAQGLADPCADFISAIDPDSDPRFVLDITIKGISVNVLVDSGSTRTYLGPIFEAVLEKQLIPVQASVLLADNSVEPVVGEVNTLFTLGRTKRSLPVRVVRVLDYDCILGIDFLINFGLKIDFGANTWELPEDPQVYGFGNTVSDSKSLVGECAGLVEISDAQRELVDSITVKYVKKPGTEL